MKRRDIIKALLSAGIFCGIAGLSGCKNKDNIKIIPKQTSKYIFSAHLPFSFDAIDELKNLNLQLKKSEIKSLYNTTPFVSSVDIFQSTRGINESIKTINDFLKYVKYAQELGFDFIYPLSTPRPFSESDIIKKSDGLFKLVSILLDNGCNKFKVANTQLIDVLLEKFPEIELSASTIFSFQNIVQYQNLFTTYPMFKTINLSTDSNRNFKFLSQLRKKFPNVEIQLLVNDPCMRACPGKLFHMGSAHSMYDCYSFLYKNWYYEFCKSGVIFPWNLEYYSALGINNFKLISKPNRSINLDTQSYKVYLEMVEQGPIPDYDIKKFFKMIFDLHTEKIADMFPSNLKLKEIINLLPDINYYIQNGHKCANICGSECNYCKKIAKKLEKKIEILKDKNV